MRPSSISFDSIFEFGFRPRILGLLTEGDKVLCYGHDLHFPASWGLSQELPATSTPLAPATCQPEDFATSGPAKPRRGLPPANPAPAKPRHHCWPCGCPPDCFASCINLPVDPLNCSYFALLCLFFENEYLLRARHFHEHARDGPSPEARLSL